MAKPKIKKMFVSEKKASKDNAIGQMFELFVEKFNEIIVLINNHDVEFTKLNLQFTQIRMDLKSAGILHDEAYVPPAVDELSPGTQPTPRKDSTKVKKFKKNDPF